MISLAAPGLVNTAFPAGTQAEYFSEVSGQWMRGVVQAFNEMTGFYTFDSGVSAHHSRVRPLQAQPPPGAYMAAPTVPCLATMPTALPQTTVMGPPTLVPGTLPPTS